MFHSVKDAVVKAGRKMPVPPAAGESIKDSGKIIGRGRGMLVQLTETQKFLRGVFWRES